jgi:hypothetical protein
VFRIRKYFLWIRHPEIGIRCGRPINHAGIRPDLYLFIFVAILTIYAPMIYTAPCIMFWMRAYPLRGEVGGGWALEFESFLGPVKWHRADRRVPFGAQKTRAHDANLSYFLSKDEKTLSTSAKHNDNQGFTKRCRSWLTNSALLYEPKCGGGGSGISANEYRARICKILRSPGIDS